MNRQSFVDHHIQSKSDNCHQAIAKQYAIMQTGLNDIFIIKSYCFRNEAIGNGIVAHQF